MHDVHKWVLSGAAIAVVSLAATGARAEPVEVVVSIKPVHSLVAAVMEGVATPALLIEGAGSPHTYSLRPSEARALERADVVFWIGEGLETFLERPLAALSADARVVELAAAEGIHLLATREGGVWEGHDHAHDHDDEHVHGDDHGHDEEHAHSDDDDHHEEHAHADEHDEEHAHAGQHHHHDGHAHGEHDMHLWLDPHNAEAMVRLIAATLAEVDPAHAEIYEANAARLEERLDALDALLQAKLEPIAERPFIVFHDAYQYLERRYGLNAAGSITVSPEQRPGARRLQEIQARLEQADAACVFAEPQFEPALVETVIEGTDARAGVLDPLGAELAAGPEQYFELMEDLADALAGCLDHAA
jgi:zinc transport system substrate-binding protein